MGSSANFIVHDSVRGAAAIFKFLARAGFLTPKFELSITNLDSLQFLLIQTDTGHNSFGFPCYLYLWAKMSDYGGDDDAACDALIS